MTHRLRAALCTLQAEVADLAEMLEDVQQLADNLPPDTRRPIPRPGPRSYQPLPARPRASVSPEHQQARLAVELGELRTLIERVPDAVQKQELAERLAQISTHDLGAGTGAAGNLAAAEISLLRALLAHTLKPRPTPTPPPAEPQILVTPSSPTEPQRPSRAYPKSRLPDNRRRLRYGVGALVGFIVVVGVAGGIARQSPSLPKAAPVALTPPSPPPAAQVSLRRSANEYVDPAGMFRCVPPPGWRMTVENTAADSRLRFQRGDDEIVVISSGANLPAVARQDRHYQVLIQQRLIRLLQLEVGQDQFSELVGARWDDNGEVFALQLGLRWVMPLETGQVMAVQFRQHGHDHTLALIMRAPSQAAESQAAFQNLVLSYESLLAATADQLATIP